MIAAVAIAAAITIEIDLTPLLRAHQLRQQRRLGHVTCGIGTVAYRFIGEPRQTFRYMGETYTIPADGTLELIAGREVPKDASDGDAFSFRDVHLPR